jgi:gliding motility-associated-like protein
MLKKVVIFLVLALPACLTHAQQNNNWYFGNNAALDFNTNPVTPLATTGFNAMEGTGSVSDLSGNLLFYTDGTVIRDRNHNVMPNGSGILGGPSSTQLLIVPKPGNCNRFYVFTPSDHTGTGDLYYTEVDMCLNNGDGDVVIGAKNVLLHTPSSEKITAVLHSNGIDIWVVTHDLGSNSFRVFPVTAAGIGTPVMSTLGTSHPMNCMIGPVKASHNGLRLAMANTFCNNLLELFDFNPSTGVVSNVVSFANQIFGWGIYGLEFSPNNQFLYATKLGISNQLWQINTTTNTVTTIAVSPFPVNYDYGMLQLAPDGKIYMARDNQNYLGVINSPDLAGTACNFVGNGLTLAPGTFSRSGLPNFIPSSISVVQPPIVNLGNDTTICSPSIMLSASTGCATYTWQDGSQQPTYNVTSSGTYFVNVTTACGTATDTIVVNTASSTSAQFSTNYSPCSPTISFTNNSTGANTYTWDFGDNTSSTATSPSHTYSSAGTYTITLTADNGGCIDTAQFAITLSQPTVTPQFTAADSVCTQQQVSFSNGSAGAISYEWSFGDGNTSTLPNPQHAYSTAGTYNVELIAINSCDTDTVSQTVTVFSYPSVSISGNNPICQGQSLTLTASGANNYQWSGGTSGTTSSVTISPSATTGYTVTSVNGVCSDSAFATVQVNPLPVINISGSTTVCEGQSTMLTATGGTVYQWDPPTGISDPNIPNPVFTPTATATYTLTVSTAAGCTGTSTVTVTSAVTPVAAFTTVLQDTGICGTTLNFINNSTGAAAYLWNFGDGTTSTAADPAHVYGSGGMHLITLTVYNDWGCSDTYQDSAQSAEPFSAFYVPNTFTPNGDGLNDRFYVKSACLQELYVEIYNRWGELVCKWDVVDGFWDGTYKGAEAQSDIYVYKLMARDHTGEYYNRIGHVLKLD